MEIKRFDDLITCLAQRGIRKRVAVVWPADETTRSAVAKVLAYNVIDAIMVGCRDEVEADDNLRRFANRISIIDADNADSAATLATAEVRAGNADVLMKGMLNTDNLLRAVLNKEHGILHKGEVLTHITVAEIPAYRKLLIFTDAAVIPYPTPTQRESQLRSVLDVARRLNTQCPKVVMVHCTEKVDPRHFAFTADYEYLRNRAAEGYFGNCVLDGPLDVKTALSPEALHKKGLQSPAGGDADALIFPDIVSANTFYKTLTLFGGATIAGMLSGTIAPVVLPSRGDSIDSKALSILLAAM